MIGSKNPNWKGGKVKRICLSCGKKFEVFPVTVRSGGGKYCSSKCRTERIGKNATGGRNPNWRGGRIRKICLNCGKEFEVFPSRVRAGHGKYCSHRCHSESLKSGEVIACLVCGKKIYIKQTDLRRGQRKLCSLRCKGIWQSKNMVGEKSSGWRGGKVESSCQACGSKFFAGVGQVKNGGGKYCSRRCYGKSKIGKKRPPISTETRKKMSLAKIKKTKRICKVCGKEFFIQPSREKRGNVKYCSKRCRGVESRGKNNPNWNGGITPIYTKVRSSPQYAQWRTRIFIRDDFTCQKCGARGGYLEAHHKKAFSILMREARDCMPLLDPYTACLLYTPMWDVSNGETLCESCHNKTRTYSIERKKKKPSKDAKT